ncbi:MAG: LamG domain-containing protein [Bacteroidota bacterium]
MKKNLRIVMCLAAFSAAVLVSCNDDNDAPVQASCLTGNLQDGLVAAYTFGAGSLTDAVGSADLTLSGGVQLGADRDGNTTCAYAFDGAQTSYLSTQAVASLDALQEFSVSFWYKPETGNGQNYQTLVSTQSGLQYPNAGDYWSIGLYDCLRATFSAEANVWDNLVTVPFTSCEDEVAARVAVWHYLTATYSLADGEIKLYHNGVLQETDELIANASPDAIGALIIGKGFKGTIDDVAIYSKVLTQADINALFALDACCQ